MRSLEVKLFNSIFKEFFNLDPLSQDLDETNGLSEIVHKRRISALGTGGVTSKNAPLSIRSIHPSFYGRLCPIDSPEGDRVGLINSLTNYARITSIGYIATPFYKTRLPNKTYNKINNSGAKKNLNFTRYSSSLQMRICPPIAFLNHSLSKGSPRAFTQSESLRLQRPVANFEVFQGREFEKSVGLHQNFQTDGVNLTLSANYRSIFYSKDWPAIRLKGESSDDRDQPFE